MPLAPWAAPVIGLAAAACTTGAFVPQLHRVWRSGSSRDISVAAFTVFAVGTFVWAVYGFLIGSVPVIAANVVTFVLVTSTLFVVFRHRAATGAPLEKAS